MKRLILASGSPRRKELLNQIHLSFDISVSNYEEIISESDTPQQVVEKLALGKAQNVFVNNKQNVVIGADTVVTFNNQILGKPNDKEEARQMITMLSGQKHVVYSGVAIISSDQQVVFHQGTEVEFWELTDEEIEAYISSEEPYDKAGGYGIQGAGAAFVKGIRGDYYTVVGLPLSLTVRELTAFEIYPENQKSFSSQSDEVNLE
ncbi:Maf family protein [Pseudalkalibacillus caeni]|uniref:dTTP/UTP pyrophosphatase n=1 Tax=Exobacillus caeni TaxID=2574798 RepID=A0A5R9F870_9BACL|nr:Maf family protein [Pseudalkalibacillus caeni]TLS39241.1 septum formation inhibitor Maf [Pseudalkalibacillus caeni]